MNSPWTKQPKNALSNPTITGTVTASQVSGIPIVLAKWGVPVILASSGTMGNNGAVSGMTALPKTYAGGAWLYLPAAAIVAGGAAGFYWFVASSTTAGTVYNSTWDGSGIPALGVTTAFATTGPGAFTGIAAGEFTAATMTVPAGAMGPNGSLKIDAHTANNTAAGNKNPRIKFGATNVFAVTLSTTSGGAITASVRNSGVASAQTSAVVYSAGTSMGSSGLVYASENTANAVTILFTMEKATATNHVIWDGADISLAYGA